MVIYVVRDEEDREDWFNKCINIHIYVYMHVCSHVHIKQSEWVRWCYQDLLFVSMGKM